MVRGTDTKLKFAACFLIVVHLFVVVLHAAAHHTLAVDPTVFQLSFIVAVIMAAPVAAGALLWKFETVGSLLLTLSMAGAFGFGVYNHFVGHSVDHIAEVADLRPEIWSTLFRTSAVALAVSEAAGTLAGVWILAGRRPRLETHAA